MNSNFNIVKIVSCTYGKKLVKMLNNYFDYLFINKGVFPKRQIQFNLSRQSFCPQLLLHKLISSFVLFSHPLYHCQMPPYPYIFFFMQKINNKKVLCHTVSAHACLVKVINADKENPPAVHRTRFQTCTVTECLQQCHQSIQQDKTTAWKDIESLYFYRVKSPISNLIFVVLTVFTKQ